MPDDLRSLFLLRDDVVFLNHGSFGACPRPVFERYQRWQRELEAQPVEFLGRRLPGLLHEARAALARYVGARPDDLVFVTNATTALNVVARSLPLEAGDEVLTCDHEYGAMDRTWRFVCARRHARLVRRPLPLPVRDPAEVADAIWSGLTERTRVLFVSHVTSPTGIVLPVAELVRRGRNAGLITVVDGAHGPGQLDLDLSALGADFYAGNAHKWLMAPKGAAFLHARPEAQPLVEPLVVSWGWESESPGASRFVDEQQWTGTRDPAAALSVPAAIEFQREHGWPEVRERCRRLLSEARAELLELDRGLEAVCPDDARWHRQMLALRLPAGVDGEALQAALLARHRVEVPVTRVGEHRFLRLSAQGYNRREDYRVLAGALSDLLS
ncbi:MAG: aminotransferase class V-fold PLP-dependent enzyme [Candidatus Krumholzibacteriia bacterium]